MVWIWKACVGVNVAVVLVLMAEFMEEASSLSAGERNGLVFRVVVEV